MAASAVDEPAGEPAVEQAVRFLRHPQSQRAPVAERVQFLRRKGVAEAHIQDALRQCALELAEGLPPSAHASARWSWRQRALVASSAAVGAVALGYFMHGVRRDEPPRDVPVSDEAVSAVCIVEAEEGVPSSGRSAADVSAEIDDLAALCAQLGERQQRRIDALAKTVEPLTNGARLRAHVREAVRESFDAELIAEIRAEIRAEAGREVGSPRTSGAGNESPAVVGSGGAAAAEVTAGPEAAASEPAAEAAEPEVAAPENEPCAGAADVEIEIAVADIAAGATTGAAARPSLERIKQLLREGKESSLPHTGPVDDTPHPFPPGASPVRLIAPALPKPWECAYPLESPRPPPPAS